MNRPTREPISKSLRFSVLKRDDFTCQYCGAHPPGVELHIDHVVPVADGGKSILANLITACRNCNASKYTSRIARGSRIHRKLVARQDPGELDPLWAVQPRPVLHAHPRHEELQKAVEIAHWNAFWNSSFSEVERRYQCADVIDAAEQASYADVDAEVERLRSGVSE